MKLLILTQKVDKNDSNLGFFHSWIREFAARCESIIVICLEEGKHDLPANVKVLSLGKEEAESRLKYVFRLYEYAWNERKKYDTVFVHMNPEYVVLCGLLWKILNKKVALWYTHKSVTLKLRIAEKLANKVFTASAESFRLPSDKLLVTGHGIDLSHFTPAGHALSGPTPHIISVGRIAPVKDYETMVRAVKRLHDRSIRATLSVIGAPIHEADHSYLDAMKKLADEIGLSSHVFFRGALPHDSIVESLRNADIFVNASNTGSLDKAGLEAIAAGCMLMSSNEAYEDVLGQYAPLAVFKKGDPFDLASKLETYARMPVEYKQKILMTLQDEVRRDHSLQALIDCLVEEMAGM